MSPTVDFKALLNKDKSLVKEEVKTFNQQQIISETGLPLKEIKEKVEEKKVELKGLISEEGALFMVGKELGVNVKIKDEPLVKITETPFVVEETPFVVETPITIESPPPKKPKSIDAEIVENEPVHETALALSNMLDPSGQPLTLKEKQLQIQQTMALVEFTANNALNEDDFWLPKGSKKKALTRSGCNKLATVFNISTETLRIWIEKEYNLKGEEDIIAYATVRATRLGGSTVTITANKALSEYKSKTNPRHPREWVDMQTLKGTAETRAYNRAVQNAIGFVPKDYMVVTKEELEKGG